jgi:uncharacterized protein (DUF924 family)
MDPRIDELLTAWFGAPGEPPATTRTRWFSRDPAWDDELRRRFGALHAEAVAGALDAWAATPRGALALVVLIDQLSRNLHRDDPRAFAHDARALAITRGARAGGLDAKLSWLERYVLLMPFMHAEDRAGQDEGVAAFHALHDEAVTAGAPASDVGALAAAVDYAERHAAIVARFGRFPHRNAVLGRPSTPDEVEFLKQPGSSF